MEPEQFLHEALGLIAFLVPIALIVVAAIFGLIVAAVITYAGMLGYEARQNRKRDARIKAERLKRDQMRIDARARAYGRKPL